MIKLSDKVALKEFKDAEFLARSVICKAVTRIAVGRTMGEVAILLGKTQPWVMSQLQRSAIESGVNAGAKDPLPLEASGARGLHLDRQLTKVSKDYAPNASDEEYIDEVREYQQQGHTPEVAKCLAKNVIVGQRAKEDGAITIDSTVKEKPVARIHLPTGMDWTLTLHRLCGNVKTAAKTLNEAKQGDFKKRETLKAVAKSHAAWMLQIERLENLHHDFDEVYQEAVEEMELRQGV